MPAARRRRLREEESMKRLHIHVAVRDLQTSIRFYSQLFAAQPSVQKPDYAKWLLEDPRVNFAISQRGGRPGAQHLGIQVEDFTELAEVHERLRQAEGPLIEEGETTCCYARSEKAWIRDPQGVQWETFLTSADSTFYGTDEISSGAQQQVSATCCAPSCCAPQSPQAP
jgi:catechol 2,3-dioxygenase-like lactoylglutathione lyase family enzyme